LRTRYNALRSPESDFCTAMAISSPKWNKYIDSGAVGVLLFGCHKNSCATMTKDIRKKPKNWSANQKKFMLWLALPSDQRLPLTQGMLARELSLDDGTLSEWKRLSGFWDAVNALVEEHLADDFAPIIESLKREARKGSIQHIRIYLEMIGKYTPRLAIDHQHRIMVEEATRLAQESGLDADAVVAEAERIMAGEA